MKRGLFCILMVCAMLFSAPTLWAQAIPKDALYTIYCRSFVGPMRAQESTLLKDRLASTGMKQWHVMHQESESTLYYGFYKAAGDDSKDSQRAEDDLKKLRKMVDADSRKVFPLALIVPIPQPGTEGPPELDLLNTPPERYWTLLVGTYAEHPERKKAAVAAVQALREQGVEAYYFHDAMASCVCVGAWPRGAVREQESDAASVPVDDRDVEMMVFNTPLPEDMPREYLTPEGKRLRLFAPKIDVADPTMKAAMDKHPHFMTNGVVMGRELENAKTGKKELFPNRSALLMIPRKDKPQQEQQQLPPDVQRRLNPTPQQKPQPKPGAGTLRRLED